MFRFIILLATSISLIECQRFVSGPCPALPSMATFDKTRVRLMTIEFFLTLKNNFEFFFLTFLKQKNKNKSF